MKFIHTLLIVNCVILLGFSHIGDSYFKPKRHPLVTALRKQSQLNHITMDSEKASVIMYHVPECKHCSIVYDEFLIEVAEMMEGMIEVFHLNCEWWNELEALGDVNTLSVCSKPFRKKLPRVMVYQPPVPRLDVRTQ